MTLTFKQAVKYEAKGRVALIGPAGSGKSYTMLTLARTLAGKDGKIAAVDTEHGSLSKYADLFQFDVLELGSFTVDAFLEALKAAEQGGYQVFCVDSLSHFWVGKDGALEFVDMAAKRYKDNMGGWKEFRPHERSMVDAMIASPCHVIVTMRTKTEYQEQVNPQTGKKQRVKIGLAPVQRDGLEYEFDLVGYMDDENTLIVDKTRSPAYSKKALTLPSAKDFGPFVEWLKGAASPAVTEKVSRQQAEELYGLAKAKGISGEDFLKYHGVTKAGDIRVDQLESSKTWIAAHPDPKPAKSAEAVMKEYDQQVEELVSAGVKLNDIGDYVEGLPFATDMAAVTSHLRTLRMNKTPEAIIKAIANRPKAEATK